MLHGLAPASEKVVEVARLVGGEAHHTGGGIWGVRVADPACPAEVYTFGMEPGDVVAYDVDVDGEYADSGELEVSADATAEEIAAAILSLIHRMEG